jgi:rhodanese-related sulfurtransferase
MTSISPLSLHQNIVSGRKLHLLDVRTPREYAQVHVPGALLAPLEDFQPERLAEQFDVSEQAPMYVLCQSGSRAKTAIIRLEKAGVSPCVLVEGGTKAWIQAGLPVERQKVSGISLERQVRIAAGFLVLTGTILGLLVHPALFGLAAFVGAGLMFAGITDICGMGMLLARLPWNRFNAEMLTCCNVETLKHENAASGRMS